VNHRLRLVVGDSSRHVAGSSAPCDVVHETDQGGPRWFLADVDALDEKPRATG
jgi:hypothetical protein